jgi:glycosyltransferase 2 family protein
MLPDRARSLRVFAYDADQPRNRRATDVLLGISSILGLALLTLVESPEPGFARALRELVAALPPMLDGVWEAAVDVTALVAVGATLAAAIRSRWSLVRDLLFAAAVGAAIALVAARLLNGVWPPAWSGVRDPLTPMYAPLRLALPAAVLVTLSPHVTLPVRRLGRWLVGLSTISLVALGAATVLGALAGLLVAVAAAAAVHLGFGSSAGRPSEAEVHSALLQHGIDIAAMSETRQQPAGILMLDAWEHNDDPGCPAPLSVKVYGRDAHGSAILSALWRTAWLREPGSSAGFGRLRQVEHEALLTLLARQAGVVTDGVVTAGLSASDDALLVLRRAPVDASSDPQVLAHGIWEALGRLHAAGIAHGQVDGERLISVGGAVGLTDFRGASVAPTLLQRLADRVQALITTTSLVGVDEAISTAREAVGDDELAQLLPMVQTPVLTPAQRREAKAGALDLDALRNQVAETLDIEVPDTLQLQRFSLGSLIRIALPVVALLGMVTALSGFDVSALRAELADATWWFVAVGFVVAQLPRLAQSVSTLGASPVPLPLGPVYALQLAVSYVNLAIPTSAARMAVNIRFFQRHGVPPGGALAAGALDGFSGLVTQAVLLTGILLLTPLSLDLDLDLHWTGSAPQLLGIFVAVAVVLLVVGLLLARVRAFVVRWSRQLLLDGIAAVRGLRSFRRVAMLFGGNMASEVLFALALGTFARAFGHGVGLGELILIVIAVSLLAGLLPIPGGIGVTEGGLIYGLVAAGVPEEVAFATVILHRLCTFYLPPIWGFVAFRWLERNRYL